MMAITSPRPDATLKAELKEWEAKNEEALGKITERVSSKYVEQIESCTTAKQAWDAVKRISEANEAHTVSKNRRIFSMARMNGDGDLIEHLSIMERCKRLLEKTEARISDTEMILRIMDSLPSSWDSFCQGIRSQQDIMKNYTRFKSAILEEADYRKMTRSSHPRTQQRSPATTARSQGTREPIAGPKEEAKKERAPNRKQRNLQTLPAAQTDSC